MIPVLRDPTTQQIQDIQAGRPVVFSRWGDGEWSCILGRPGHNKAGMPYSAPLRRDLTAVLTSPSSYPMGLCDSVIHGRSEYHRIMAEEVAAWIEAHAVVSWVAGDGIYQLSLEGRLRPFIEALATRTVIMVGPDYLRELRLFPMAGHVRVPARMRHEDHVDRLVDQTGTLLSQWPSAVVTISAGMTANVLVDCLARAFPLASLLDCGSVWEPYTGRSVRNYHPAIIAREQRGATV